MVVKLDQPMDGKQGGQGVRYPLASIRCLLWAVSSWNCVCLLPEVVSNPQIAPKCRVWADEKTQLRGVGEYYEEACNTVKLEVRWGFENASSQGS